MTRLADFAELRRIGEDRTGAVSVREDLLPPSLQQPSEHTVELVPAWTADTSRLSSKFKESHRISRGDLFACAEDARNGSSCWTQLLIDTFAWGWGGTSLGPSRLSRVLNSTESETAENSLNQAVHTLYADGPIAAYWDLNNTSRYRLKYLGPAFFTKFLYFASGGTSDGATQPLILDRIVAGRVNQLIGQPGCLSTGAWRTRDYAFYLALMSRLAARLNERDDTERWTMDAVELGIFKTPMR